MRPLRTFTVEPALPEKLSPLLEIARNLWWCWRGEALELFRRLDPQLWEQLYHNPVAVLGAISQDRLQRLARDEGFISHLLRVYSQLEYYLTNDGWWPKTYGPSDKPIIAYFCAEFGLTECLPIYSGGLGVLAGDHLKSASEMDLPLVGASLLYQQGYFRQRLNADGWQLELYPRNDFHNMPVEQVNDDNGQPLMVTVDFPNRQIHCHIWRARVGRVDLYMLDTNVPANAVEDRPITAQLYGGDQEMRIRQEIVLGIGGVRMLKALGFEPKTYHMNEGHSAFLSLERIRMLMAEHGVSFHEAREAVAASNVFTTHTPVPAGNDAFAPWLVEKYLSHYWTQLGLGKDEFLNLGRNLPPAADEPMNLTIFAMRMSRSHNGVSHLHGQVSRKLWSKVWPSLPLDEVPIKGLVNGVHTLTWISHDMATLYDRYLGPGWYEKPADIEVWQAAQHIPDEELWRTHERRRERLVAFVRRRLQQQLERRGAGQSELRAAEEALDPEALTIGFARRFATYKRANLILADLERLKHILGDGERRVQIIFAGKAHPRDNPGKDLIRQIVHTSREEPFRTSLVFLEDYDMNAARYMVQGVDVWLNTPLRPMEASGTSGMKVAANGGLNVSIPDGWWAEAYDPTAVPAVGWSIGAGEEYEDLDYQNSVESHALYDLLEKDIVPRFYDRGSDNLPRQWVAMMKAAITRLAPTFNTNRMVRDYCEQFYVPAANHWDELTSDEFTQARELSGWKHKLTSEFDSVSIESVKDNMDGQDARVGRDIRVDAVVALGGLSTEDVRVELYYGKLDDDGQLTRGTPLRMEHTAEQGDNRHRYAVDMPCDHSGMTGYTVRVMPGRHSSDDTRVSSLIRWA
ncbi:MAG: alpha-glucan family phosphorylase [Planctomycetes bacterium]|jgi:starch phosphorylase|nr:alpha-glucan family phosphorylase [Phycisphaerae bacterium]NBB94166.1 alpha-glucan family phosphorylase [Planctomycetota bacterium]